MKKYSSTEAQRFLLDWRVNHVGNGLERYLVYYQLGCENNLKQVQRDYLWDCVNGFIGLVTKTKFKQRQSRRDRPYSLDDHVERVLLFYELAKAYHDPKKYPPLKLCSQFQSRFYEYEAYLQFKRLGIELTYPDGRKIPITSITACPVIRNFVMYFHMRRLKMTFEEYHLKKMKTYPSRNTILRWFAWEIYIADVIGRSGGLVTYQMFEFWSPEVFNDEYVQQHC